MRFLNLKKKSPRRTQVSKNIPDERFARITPYLTAEVIISLLICSCFTILSILILSFESVDRGIGKGFLPITFIVLAISAAMAAYIHHYQSRIIKNHARALALASIFVILLAATKIGVLLAQQSSWATGSAVAAAIILVIAYNQRFALGMSVFFCLLAHLAAGSTADIGLFLTMLTGAVICCFSLREIRTRMKLLEVSAIATAAVFVISVTSGYWTQHLSTAAIFINAGYHAIAAFVVGLLMQSLLPLIEKYFHIATSMTLLDYSDANQPLLKRLAMEAPGTFSHSLLVGSVAEAAAEAIGRNGLLCRVGAYYHDIGKINKPGYFVENELGSANRHKELSPAMSQLIIVGHVKDGIEMAKEYGLPAVLRQFIETHHGKTLIEYFFNEAKKKHGEKQHNPSESEFRYTGPLPRTKEAAIVMLSDSSEGAARSLSEITPAKIENVVHNITMKRLQDGQLDECDLSLHDLSRIEASISKTLAAHHHGRIAYPTPADAPEAAEPVSERSDTNQKND